MNLDTIIFHIIKDLENLRHIKNRDELDDGIDLLIIKYLSHASPRIEQDLQEILQSFKRNKIPEQ